ncbi:MAG: flavodoxin family protein [Deltaproteobacteria bacterium]|nr:flavodoxin family protein [Deltaproteobacteria bacterium]
MKITAFNGSPKGKNGNTFIMVDEFLKGAISVGAEAEQVLLSEKKIHHCIGCLACWTKTPGKCIFEDDMRELLPKFDTDFIVFACPVYVDNVTGLMKNFMDRMIPIADPHFTTDERGESRHVMPPNYKFPKLVIISNCGFPEQSHFEVFKVLFKRVARNMHTEVAAEIYRGEGELMKMKSLLLKPFQYKYKKLLQRCGKEVMTDGRLSDETIEKLEKPIVPPDQYSKHANKHWDRELAKLK